MMHSHAIFLLSITHKMVIRQGLKALMSLYDMFWKIQVSKKENYIENESK